MEANKSLERVRNRFLTFLLEDEKYGIEILSVREIIGYQKATPIPRSPVYVRGVLNLRGVLIPVIDLRAKLDMPPQEPQSYTAIVIVSIHETSIGFIVDRVEEVKALSEDQLSDPPRMGSKVDTEYIKQMARIGEEVVLLLDLDHVVDIEEAKGLGELSGNNKSESKKEEGA